MRILIISKSNSDGSGASRVAAQLAQDLHKSQFTCNFFNWSDNSHSNLESRFSKNHKVNRIYFGVRNIERRLTGNCTLPIECISSKLRKLVEQSDIVHIHDVWETISSGFIRYVSQLKPTIITLHDFSLLTKACLYPKSECFQSGIPCSTCPGGRTPNWKSCIVNKTYQYKLDCIQSPNITITAPSRWLCNYTQDQGISPSQVHYVPNYVDYENFRPKSGSKEKLGIPLDETPTILISAQSLSNARKNIPNTLTLLKELKNDGLNFRIITQGQFNSEAQFAFKGLDPIVLPYTQDNNRLAESYNAADLFLFPSLIDNCPLALLECGACSTPMIGYKSSGVAEIIDQESGFLVSDENKLKTSLNDIIQKRSYESKRETTRGSILKRFPKNSILENTIEIYQDSINRFHPNSFQF